MNILKLLNDFNITILIQNGYHSMVFDYKPWSDKISKRLKNIVETNISVLKICYRD